MRTYFQSAFEIYVRLDLNLAIQNDLHFNCIFSIVQLCIRFNKIITFCVSRRRRKMCCGHARLCLSVCLSVRSRMPTLLHGPGCNLGEW